MDESSDDDQRATGLANRDIVHYRPRCSKVNPVATRGLSSFGCPNDAEADRLPEDAESQPSGQLGPHERDGLLSRPGAGSDAAAPDGHVTDPQLALLPASEPQLQLHDIARLVRRRLDRRTRANVHISQPDP